MILTVVDDGNHYSSPYSSSDIPMAMGGSLSSQDEVVEAIKVDLQAQEMGTVKVSRLITYSRE